MPVAIGQADMLVNKLQWAGHLGSASVRTGTSPTLWIVVSIAACLLLIAWSIALVVIGFRSQPKRDDGRDDGGPGGEGPEPPDVGPDPEPVWWAQFEQDLAAYEESLVGRR